MNKLSTLVLVLTFIVSTCVGSYDLSFKEKEDAHLIGGLSQMINSGYRWLDMCSNMYEENHLKYENAFEMSSVNRFSKLFKFDESLVGSITAPKKQLAKQGMTDIMMKEWCETKFYDFLADFDKKYAHRYEEVAALLSERRQNITKN